MPQNASKIENPYSPAEQWSYLCQFILPEDQETLTSVYRYATRVHEGEYRRSAESSEPIPYIVHPLRVARILAEEWEDKSKSSLAAALLHDVLEYCHPTRLEEMENDITRLTNREVRDAVRALTKPRLPEPCPPDAKAAREARYFSQLRAASNWVRLVKCADRVDNLRDARAWGDKDFWTRYSSETLGWHLFLARETAPIAEVALFKALVEGERDIRGRVPVWADGNLIDPVAAALVPENIARDYGAIGLAVRGDLLIVGMRNPKDIQALATLRVTTQKEIEALPISQEALNDALSAELFGF